MKTFETIKDHEIARLLKTGSIGVIPTDTLYGIVSSAALPSAVDRMYAAKHREHKPGTLVAASIEQLVELGLKRRYLTAVAQFWPGAVSVIIPCDGQLEYLHRGVGSLAVRIPGDESLRVLLESSGPLATSSANQPGLPPATNLSHAVQYFGETVDFYVDGGDMSGSQPSTIIKVVDDEIVVIRQGAVVIG